MAPAPTREVERSYLHDEDLRFHQFLVAPYLAVGRLNDVHTALDRLRPLCHRDTRIVVAYLSRQWAPVLKATRWAGPLDSGTAPNWLSAQDVAALLGLAGFEVVRLTVVAWRRLKAV